MTSKKSTPRSEEERKQAAVRAQQRYRERKAQERVDITLAFDPALIERVDEAVKFYGLRGRAELIMLFLKEPLTMGLDETDKYRAGFKSVDPNGDYDEVILEAKKDMLLAITEPFRRERELNLTKEAKK